MNRNKLDSLAYRFFLTITAFGAAFAIAASAYYALIVNDNTLWFEWTLIALLDAVLINLIVIADRVGR